MSSGTLLAEARRSAGLSQQELARKAGTSREAVSAYENDRKSPNMKTVERLLVAAHVQLEAVPQVTFASVTSRRGAVLSVPDRLPRLPVQQAVARVQLPIHLNWSDPERVFDLADRHDRARVYEIVIREGRAEDISTYVDGALLVDVWEDLVLPTDVREAWAAAIGPALSSGPDARHEDG
ncbi:MAG: helix-turn-helix transcriptional regulator [Candidatus Nanopelagicales bacterium]|nr:helix-turn-helix transcriptional regulator [Candidatus Nanopelagicales bacterium]